MVDRRVPGSRPFRLPTAPLAIRPELAAVHEWWEAGAGAPLVLFGPVAVGKSTLARAFAAQVARTLGDPHAVHVRRLQGDAVPGAEELAAQVAPTGRALIVLDDADMPQGARSALAAAVNDLRASQPRIGVLVTCQLGGGWAQAWLQLEVGPLNEGASLELLEAVLGRGIRREDFRALARASTGEPVVLLTLAELARIMPVDQVLARLEEQRVVPVYPAEELFAGPGRDAPGESGPAARELDVRVAAVSDELIARLVARPELMYALRPRQFEELLAGIFARQGFDVELTQQTRDGGIDLYVVHHTPAGRLLTLVDAKRNRADRPVGVGIVRQLYGVVEARKASAGLIATTSFFSPEARALQAEIPFRLELRDYFDLQTMLEAAAAHSAFRLPTAAAAE
jgi:restriction system protein